MDAFEETFTRIARIADVQKHRPDVMQRYLEDGKVVEIVDLLTGKFHDGAREDQATSRT
jgi:pterin-4a-carbinolamine dehydratase